jgi:3-methyladenine DNA glycosylase AlkC
MAEPLKHQFGPQVPRDIARMVTRVHGDFDARSFVRASLKGLEALELLPRAWHIAHALRAHLPDDYPKAAAILVASLGPKLESAEEPGPAPFFYLPHAFMVAGYGLDDFEASMHAQYEITQRFTAEFSIRPFLDRYPEATLARLMQWTRDASPHVRRLVSEGTRPRLPWAPRLRAFQADPRPVLELLEQLKDDSALYVRRSVANNLNDIGKDHPAVLVETARRWLAGDGEGGGGKGEASENRQWLVKHALRSAVKRGDPAALQLLGFGAGAKVTVRNVRIAPQRVKAGGTVTIAFELHNNTRQVQDVLADFRVHFIKANGKPSARVFKLKTVQLAPDASAPLGKSLSLVPMTTRKHYPGTHRVDALINGQVVPLGEFELHA